MGFDGGGKLELNRSFPWRCMQDLRVDLQSEMSIPPDPKKSLVSSDRVVGAGWPSSVSPVSVQFKDLCLRLVAEDRATVE